MRKLQTRGKKMEVGHTVPEVPASRDERDKLVKWSCVASLMVFRGMSGAAAYRAVFDEPEAVALPPAIANNSRFRGMLAKLRASQGMTNEEIHGNIESLYLGLLHDEEAPLKARLQAAAQLQKLRGLEKMKVAQEVDADIVILQQAMQPKKIALDDPRG